MTVPEALRVDTDGGIKPDMAFLALLCECKPGMLPYSNLSARASSGFIFTVFIVFSSSRRRILLCLYVPYFLGGGAFFFLSGFMTCRAPLAAGAMTVQAAVFIIWTE